jgi:hypothetical protein
MQHCMHLGNPAEADARASRVLGRRKDPLAVLLMMDGPMSSVTSKSLISDESDDDDHHQSLMMMLWTNMTSCGFGIFTGSCWERPPWIQKKLKNC